MTAISGTSIGIDVVQRQAMPYGNSTVSFTIANYPNRVVYVSAHSDGSGFDVGEPVGWTELAAIGNVNDRGFTRLYQLINPPIGANSYTFSSDSTNGESFLVVSFYNVNQSTPHRTVYTDGATSSIPNITVADSASGDLVVDWNSYYLVSDSTPGVGQTDVYSGNYTFCSYKVATGINTTMTWNHSGDHAHIGMALVPILSSILSPMWFF